MYFEENSEEYKKLLVEYKEKQLEWRTLARKHISTVNTTYTTLSIAFFSFIFKATPSQLANFFRFHGESTSSVFLAFSFHIVLLSVFCGLATLLIRLSDFRLSRNLARTRVYLLERNKSSKGLLPSPDVGYIKRFEVFRLLLKVIFSRRIRTVNELDELSDEDLRIEFSKDQRFSDKLGATTWLLLKWQILFFALAILTYACHLLL